MNADDHSKIHQLQPLARQATSLNERNVQRQLARQARMEPHREEAPSTPLFGAPIKIDRPDDIIHKRVSQILGNYEDAKSMFMQPNFSTGLPSTPEPKNARHDNIFTSFSSELPNGKSRSKSNRRPSSQSKREDSKKEDTGLNSPPTDSHALPDSEVIKQAVAPPELEQKVPAELASSKPLHLSSEVNKPVSLTNGSREFGKHSSSKPHREAKPEHHHVPKPDHRHHHHPETPVIKVDHHNSKPDHSDHPAKPDRSASKARDVSCRDKEPAADKHSRSSQDIKSSSTHAIKPATNNHPYVDHKNTATHPADKPAMAAASKPPERKVPHTTPTKVEGKAAGLPLLPTVTETMIKPQELLSPILSPVIKVDEAKKLLLQKDTRPPNGVISKDVTKTLMARKSDDLKIKIPKTESITASNNNVAKASTNLKNVLQHMIRPPGVKLSPIRAQPPPKAIPASALSKNKAPSTNKITDDGSKSQLTDTGSGTAASNKARRVNSLLGELSSSDDEDVIVDDEPRKSPIDKLAKTSKEGVNMYGNDVKEESSSSSSEESSEEESSDDDSISGNKTVNVAGKIQEISSPSSQLSGKEEGAATTWSLSNFLPPKENPQSSTSLVDAFVKHSNDDVVLDTLVKTIGNIEQPSVAKKAGRGRPSTKKVGRPVKSENAKSKKRPLSRTPPPSKRKPVIDSSSDEWTNDSIQSNPAKVQKVLKTVISFKKDKFLTPVPVVSAKPKHSKPRLGVTTAEDGSISVIVRIPRRYLKRFPKKCVAVEEGPVEEKPKQTLDKPVVEKLSSEKKEKHSSEKPIAEKATVEKQSNEKPKKKKVPTATLR